ncbi:MAG: prolipoprotein diacylglyceryl transferase [Deltaproteobacteria bacterium]|nr:prolipoprotein diacylglyceryl transferase [Deltaproteobacteria bacterium]
MHPVLLNLGKFSIYTYGFFVAMGFLAAIWFATREAKRCGVDHEKIMDLSFYVLIAAIVGSRLAYVATVPGEFAANPLDMFKIWKGGLVFYGGFVGAMLTAIIYLRARHLPIWKTGDIIAPALALGHFLGRIGCFFAGCCYGKTCELPWSITFHDPASLAPINIPLHPTQLYSSAGNLMIFLVLLLVRRHRKFEGQIFWLYVLLYGVTRSVIEIFRGDYRGGGIMGVLSVSQTVGCSFAIVAVVMLVVLAGKTGTKKVSR